MHFHIHFHLSIVDEHRPYCSTIIYINFESRISSNKKQTPTDSFNEKAKKNVYCTSSHWKWWLLPTWCYLTKLIRDSGRCTNWNNSMKCCYTQRPHSSLTITKSLYHSCVHCFLIAFVRTPFFSPIHLPTLPTNLVQMFIFFVHCHSFDLLCCCYSGIVICGWA